jgi:hypothetical protein
MELKDAIIDYINNIDGELTCDFSDRLFDLIEDNIPSPHIKTYGEKYYAVIVDNIMIGIDVYRTFVVNINICKFGIIYSGKRLTVNSQYVYCYEDNSDIIDKLHQYFDANRIDMFVDTIRSNTQNGRSDRDLNWLFTTTQCKSAKKYQLADLH